MTVNRTTLLDLPLPVTGTESGTWGDTTNNGLTQYLDIAIAGMSNLTSANFTAGALTIETTEGDSSATNISATSAQYAGFRVSSLAANSTITVGNTGTSPARSYRLINADATYNLTFKATGQTGVTLLPGQSAVVAFNGTDYVIVGTVGAGTATDNAVARFDGTTGEILQNSAATIDDTGAATFVGSVNVSGTSASAADLKLYEDTDNGTNYVAFKSPASVASNVTWTLPSADGTNGQALTTNGSGTLAFSSVTTAPGGSDTQVQFNDSGSFGGDAGLTYNKTTDTLTTSVVVHGAGSAALPSITTTGDTNTGVYFPAADTAAITTGGSERMRVDSSGRVLINTTTSIGGNNKLQVVDDGTANIQIFTGRADQYGPQYVTGKSRGTTASPTIVQSNDDLGALVFRGYDGAAYINGAKIEAQVDATPGSNDMPGRLTFWTTADGSASATERMRIDSSGNVGIGVTPSAWGSAFKVLQLANGTSLANNGQTSYYQIGANNYYDGTNYKYIDSNYAAYHSFSNLGAYEWRIANSGTAGTNVTFTQVLALEQNKSLALQGATPQSGAGITFPATQSASSNGNTLDDYEEGTWTPNQGTGLTVVGAFSSSGSYTKIGRLVMLNCVYAGATSVAVTTNGLMSDNLPFTSLSTGPRYNCGSLTNYAITSGGTSVNPENTANLYSATAIAATAYLSVSITYVVG
jgi:hypothetical protein